VRESTSFLEEERRVTKQEFVDQISSRTDLSRRDAAKAVDAFLETQAVKG
jgi:nucleoid DNA-binding protein